MIKALLISCPDTSLYVLTSLDTILIPIKPYELEFGTPSINSGNSDERFSNVPIQNLIDHENYITDQSINPHLKYTNTRDHGYSTSELRKRIFEAEKSKT